MLTQKFFEINKCIYCGGEGKTDEHVIPYALGGTMVLKKASCEECRDLSSRCERNPLNKNFSEVRASLDLPSRKRDFKSETFPLKVILQNGERVTLNFSSDETLGLVQLLEYGVPAFFNPVNFTIGSTVTGARIISFGNNVNEIINKYGIKTIISETKHKGNNFEIMIAKIAYTYVIAFWGLDCFDERFVLPAILGDKDDVGFWVGCDHIGKIMPLIGKQTGRNAMKMGIWRKKGDPKRYILVRLKLFLNSDSPEYLIVVGTLRSDFAVPQ